MTYGTTVPIREGAGQVQARRLHLFWVNGVSERRGPETRGGSHETSFESEQKGPSRHRGGDRARVRCGLPERTQRRPPYQQCWLRRGVRLLVLRVGARVLLRRRERLLHLQLSSPPSARGRLQSLRRPRPVSLKGVGAFPHFFRAFLGVLLRLRRERSKKQQKTALRGRLNQETSSTEVFSLPAAGPPFPQEEDSWLLVISKSNGARLSFCSWG